MTALQQADQSLRAWTRQHFLSLYDAARSGFALLGLLLFFASLTLVMQPELRHTSETQLMGWLQNRHSSKPLQTEPPALERATAVHPRELSKQQAAVAFWLSRKYRVAPEPVAALVLEAYEIGRRTELDPLLLLSVMAIESGFNPFAQSPMGAQGLMQVITRVHGDKYQAFGGNLAAFDPVTNLRVGARVLHEYIQRAGSVEGGLRIYVGAAYLPDDGGYAAKVLAEHARLQQVLAGQAVATFTASPVQAIPVTNPAKPSEDAESSALDS